jgi:hypothetical protein
MLGFLPEGAPTYPEMTVTGLPALLRPACAAIAAALAERVDYAIGLTRIWKRPPAAGRDAVERLQAPRRPGAGAAARSAGAGAGRADRRPRPQPEARGARADRQMRPDKAIVISTHILEEVDAVCTRAIIIAAGRVVATRRRRSCSEMHPVRPAGRRVPMQLTLEVQTIRTRPEHAQHSSSPRRELGGYFATPVASVFIVIFLVLQGALTFNLGNFFEPRPGRPQSVLHFIPWVFLLLVPAITMRLWAEERRLGTIELLLTLPITQPRRWSENSWPPGRSAPSRWC